MVPKPAKNYSLPMGAMKQLDVDKTQADSPQSISQSASHQRNDYDKFDTLNVGDLFVSEKSARPPQQAESVPLGKETNVRGRPYTLVKILRRRKTERPVLDQELFDKTHGYRRVDLTLGRRVLWHFKQVGKWRKKEWWRFICTLVPIFGWMPRYKWKDWIVADLIGGIMCAVMSVPQGLAYGYMVGVPPNFGLITGIFGPLIYAILGTSKHTSPGSFAIVSLMVGSAVEKHSQIYPIENGTDPEIVKQLNQAEAINVAMTITLMIGIFQIIFALLNMGLLAVWLSDQLVEGLTSGAAVHVLTSQIKSMTGIKSLPATNSPFALPKFYICFGKQIAKTNIPTLVVALLSVFLLLFSCYCIDPILKKYIRIKFPMEFILVAYSVLLVYLSEGTQYHIYTQVVGQVDSGLMSPKTPDHPKWVDMIGDAITTAVISFVIHISLAKMIAKKLNYEVDANQEWFALGFMHFFSSWFGCFAGGSSLGRSMTQVKFGTKSQMSTLICCGILFGCVYGAAAVIFHLPKAVLAAIVVVAMKDLYVQLFRSFALFNRSYTDFLIYLVTLLSVVFINVMYGLIIGVCFALLSVIFRTQWAESTCMGRIPGTADFKGLGHYKMAEEVAGVKVFRFDAPLYFANAETFISRMYTACGVNPIQVRASMQEKEEEHKRKMKKKASQSSRQEEGESFVSDKPLEIQVKKVLSKDRPAVEEENQLTHIVIDCSSIPYVDLMGKDALAQCYVDYKAIDITVLFSHCKVAVRQTFETTDFYSVVPKNRMFVSLEDAVTFAQRERKKTSEIPEQKSIKLETKEPSIFKDSKSKKSVKIQDSVVAHSPAQKTIKRPNHREPSVDAQPTQSFADITGSTTTILIKDFWETGLPVQLKVQRSQDSMDKTQ